MIKNGLTLGLDIGVTSVGWGIIKTTELEVVDAGVRLFSERDTKNNETRRIKRSTRRRKNRKTTRRRDLNVLFNKFDIETQSFEKKDNILEIRVKGINEPLTMEELYAVSLYLLKHRGHNYEMIDSGSDEDEANDDINNTLVKFGKYVCEIQLERLNNNGYYRGTDNKFKTEEYEKEFLKILSNIGIDSDFKDELFNIIFRRRHYSEGPGSEKSPTEYGRFLVRDGEVIKIDLIDKMLGKCSLFPEEVRAPHKSYSAEYFNVLNDINNLKIKNENLTEEEKEIILDLVNDKFTIKPKDIFKALEIDETDVRGFREDKDKKPIFTQMEGTKKIHKIFKDAGYSHLFSKELQNEISNILLRKKTVEERCEDIRSLVSELPEEVINKIAKLTGFSKTHALSLKALNILIPILETTELNQMQIISDKNLFPYDKSNEELEKSKNIKFDDDELILSGVARRAMNETFKVVNALRRKYGEFDRIIVEMTRAKNSDEQRKNLQQSQKFFETQWKQAEELAKDHLQGKKLNLQTMTKIRLYNEQNGKCIYTDEAIDLATLINDPHAYEIDHIIPLSVSLDDSYSNKVLCLPSANQNKGNRTPYDAVKNGKFGNQSWEQFRTRITNNYQGKELRKKRGNLLFDKDIHKWSNLERFINRNLVDTSYAARVVLNTLQSYFKTNEIDTKVHTIRGSVTGAFRKRVVGKEQKDRDKYKHHAIDALVIAAMTHQQNVWNMMNSYKVINGEVTVVETGEVVKVDDDKKFLQPQLINFIREIMELDSDETVVNPNKKTIKFSHKVDRKPNRQISDETIYSTRTINGEEKVVKKYKDIYDPKFTALADDIVNNKYQDKYLMALHDQKTFSKIKEIVLHYFNEFKNTEVEIKNKNGKETFAFKFNPLHRHKEQTGEVIRKYSKKNNGPIINQMKYFDSNLGNHISITQNYKPKNKNVVLLQISPYRTDFYKNNDNRYKFVTVRYSNVQFMKEKGKYVIDKDWYENEKARKGIDESYEFLFSLHRGDVFELTKSDSNGIVSQMYKFTATNNDKKIQ